MILYNNLSKGDFYNIDKPELPVNSIHKFEEKYNEIWFTTEPIEKFESGAILAATLKHTNEFVTFLPDLFTEEYINTFRKEKGYL